MRTAIVIRSTIVALGLVAGACSRNPRANVGVRYVVREPPVERVEVISRAPGNDYVWVKGHWAWRRDDYEWIGGHWAIPDRGAREWEPGRWEHDRNGWFWIEGRWR